MNETKWWRCDTCHERIEAVEDGWVEWLALRGKGDFKSSVGLKLVHHVSASPRKHHGGCQYDQDQEFKARHATLMDGALENFLGPDGLVDLLSMLEGGELPRAEVVEMIQRLHVPGYEEARPFFERALAEGEIETNLPPGFFSQSMIRGVIAAYGEPDEDDEPGS
jgi:hypothetical protein